MLVTVRKRRESCSRKSVQKGKSHAGVKSTRQHLLSRRSGRDQLRAGDPPRKLRSLASHVVDGGVCKRLYPKVAHVVPRDEPTCVQ